MPKSVLERLQKGGGEDSVASGCGSKLSVALVIRDLQRAGAQRQLAALVEGLGERGHRVAVITLRETGPLGDDVRRSGAELIEPFRADGRRVSLFRQFARIAVILYKFKVDVVYGFMPLSSLFALVVPSPRRTKRIIGVRGSNRDWAHYERKTRLVHRTVREAAFRADKVIANSTSGCEYFVTSGRARVDITVVPNGIDTRSFKPASERLNGPAAPRRGGERVIGALGRMHPMKGYAGLLDALCTEQLELLPWKLVLAGRAGSATKFIQRKRQAQGLHDRVSLLGELAESKYMYNSIDIFVSCSLYGEGFPNVVGEAMACGLPCIVTDVGDSREVVGDTGWLVPPGDTEALVRALRDALTRPSEDLWRLGSYARERIVEEFSQPRMVLETEAVFRAT